MTRFVLFTPHLPHCPRSRLAGLHNYITCCTFVRLLVFFAVIYAGSGPPNLSVLCRSMDRAGTRPVSSVIDV